MLTRVSLSLSMRNQDFSRESSSSHLEKAFGRRWTEVCSIAESRPAREAGKESAGSKLGDFLIRMTYNEASTASLLGSVAQSQRLVEFVWPASTAPRQTETVAKM